MSNTFKISLINYQRIHKATMEFIPGLNLVIGGSNNGKSAAALRAPETAIYNIPREDHITLGETKSAVGIQYNGHEVIWRRDKESSSQVTYRIDGKIYSKLGRGQPKEVADALGISEIELNDKKIRLNFSKQMSYPFLLDSTPSDMFKFIAQSSGEDNLIDVLKQMKKDVSEISVSVKGHEEAQKVLGESLVSLESKYKEIKDKRTYCEQVLDLETKVNQLRDLREKIDVYKKCNNAIDKMTNSLNYYKGIFNDLSSSVSVLDSYIKKLSDIRNITDDYYSLQNNLEVYKSKLRKNDDYILLLVDLDRQYDKFKSQDVNREKYTSIKSLLDRYNKGTEDLSVLTNQKENIDHSLTKYNKFITAIGTVLEIKDSKEEILNLLRHSISDYNNYQFILDSYIEDINKLNNDLELYEKSISEIGVCPYCGSVLTGGLHEQH